MNRVLKSIALLVFLVLGGQIIIYGQNGHPAILFNDNWQFHLGDIDTTGLLRKDTATWRAVQIPHDWSIEGPFSESWASGTGFAPGGIGWYRKMFKLTPKADQQIFLYFDGVSENSEVWINGHFLGKRPSGVISFQYELSPYLKSNGDNELLVKVDHSEFADSRFYTGSGIYRNVYLVTTNRIHIAPWGVAFTTPSVGANSADARVSVSILNTLASRAAITVRCTLTDNTKKVVGTDSKQLTALSGDTADTNFQFTVRNPQLWSVDNPNLYQLAVTVSQGGKTVDEWKEKVGIRSIRFDPNDGFFLNGQNIKIKGVCLHDDAGVLGVAVPKEVWERRLKVMKAAGANAIRMAHDPHADYFYDLCDKMGFLVMDENFDEWEGAKNKWIKGWNKGKPGKDGSHEYFDQWGVRDISDMVCRDRNHPSIIMWSIGNEIDYPGDPYIDPDKKPSPDHPSAARLGEISKELVAAVKLYDQSRPVTAALAGVEMSNKTTLPGNLDIVGYNYQEFRYEKDHKDYPERIIFGSENSKKLDAWKAVEKNKFIAGQFIWTGIDHLGEAHDWPEHASKNGMVDMAGFPKAEFYFRQSLWLDTPMIQIGTTDIPDAKNPDPYPKQGQPDWNYNAGDRKRVNCFTNCPEAELFLNGTSLGKKKLSDFENRVISWDVNYAPGTLTVKGYTADGRTISHTLKTAGAAYAIDAKADASSLNEARQVTNVVIGIVDRNGLPVFNADNRLTVTVKGPGRLLGLENGAIDDMEPHGSDSKNVLHGKLVAYVEWTGKSGPVKISIQSGGLKPKVIVIQTKNSK